MKLQLLRNATMRIEYAGNTILTDPMLEEKYKYDSFVGRSPNPLVDLPMSIEEILNGLDACIISHLHLDHFDPKAQEVLTRDLKVFCPPVDAENIKSVGLTNVEAIEDSVTWEGVEITRTPGRHGDNLWHKQMGEVSGFILRAEKEPTVYWVGDSVFYEEVENVINENKPDVIIIHASGDRFGNAPPVVMDTEQTLALCKFAPDAKIVAVHMESMDIFKITRDSLRNVADKHHISADHLLIPLDGDVLEF